MVGETLLILINVHKWRRCMVFSVSLSSFYFFIVRYATISTSKHHHQRQHHNNNSAQLKIYNVIYLHIWCELLYMCIFSSHKKWVKLKFVLQLKCTKQNHCCWMIKMNMQVAFPVFYFLPYWQNEEKLLYIGK